MNLDGLKSVYFIGIGGIGMSAIARYFHKKGIAVAGYDRTSTELTRTLEQEGIAIHYTDDVALLPTEIDLVVYTPAVPATHKELVYLTQAGVPVMKRAAVLGLISKTSQTIAIAGTHGKTTTSSICAHLLKASGLDVSAFLGGILSGYESNYFLGASPWVVVEADEFDRSFLHLYPTISVVNSLDADHLDIYKEANAVYDAFLAFLHNTKPGACIYVSEDALKQLHANDIAQLTANYEVRTFGFDPSLDIVASAVGPQDGFVRFELTIDGKNLGSFDFRMPGNHNIKNAIVGIDIALRLLLPIDNIKASLASFQGIKRRFEWIYNEDGVVYIDDYAHHPTELAAAISAVRQMFAGKKVLGIFQPHLYTRTRDFAAGFAEELSKLDTAILMDIYPARELPIAGVTSDIIYDAMPMKDKYLMNEEEILSFVRSKKYDVILSLGAGDIDLIVPKIKNILINRKLKP